MAAYQVQDTRQFSSVCSETSEEAIPVEIALPAIGNPDFSTTSVSTKYSEAPEAIKTWTGLNSNDPFTTADFRLEGALASRDQDSNS